MKKLFLGALAFCIGTACFAAPEFVGVLASRDVTYLAVRAEPSSEMRWVQIGDRLGEYRLISFDAKKEVAVFRRGDADIVVSLRSSKVQSAPTLALLESLVKAGDTTLETSLQQARVLEAQRSKTALDLAHLEARAAQDSRVGESVPHIRRKLRLEEGNLEFYLQNLIEAARKKIGDSK